MMASSLARSVEVVSDCDFGCVGSPVVLNTLLDLKGMGSCRFVDLWVLRRSMLAVVKVLHAATRG